MKDIVATIIVVISICLGAYVGGWLMFVQPILQACSAFDLGLLTASVVGATVLKCILASPVGLLITSLGMTIGAMFYD